ncbi:ImmA/IrrE family metallo-endopeptidase [Helcococcus bovis]|uniref:ImmA/IrrE family metallo-endopeptidase n=1 Tax=Helcococcus bovis TaxID=3153252 RepID=UPI0038B8A255
MKKQEIKDIVAGLVEECGSRNIYDILDYLNIKVIVTAIEDTIFVRIRGEEIILLSDTEPEELIPFALAHEVGHAVLHDVEMWYFEKLGISKKCYEDEADYFAFKLLDKKIDKTLNYTIEEYAKELCVSENTIKYVVGLE